MTQPPPCPNCASVLAYEDGPLLVCPECAHEWSRVAAAAAPGAAEEGLTVRDANGVILADGDAVTIVKDLRLKGGGGVLKVGTKVKNIRLVEGDHNIDCRIDGFGQMALKSEFVRKA